MDNAGWYEHPYVPTLAPPSVNGEQYQWVTRRCTIAKLKLASAKAELKRAEEELAAYLKIKEEIECAKQLKLPLAG